MLFGRALQLSLESCCGVVSAAHRAHTLLIARLQDSEILSFQQTQCLPTPTVLVRFEGFDVDFDNDYTIIMASIMVLVDSARST